MADDDLLKRLFGKKEEASGARAFFNLALFLLFVFVHYQTYSKSVSFGLLIFIWCFVMPLSIALIRTRNFLSKETGAYFLFAAGFGLAAVLLPYGERTLSLLLGGFFEIFNGTWYGTFFAFFIVFFPVGLIPFILHEHQYISENWLGRLFSAQGLATIYLLIWIVISFVYFSDQIDVYTEEIRGLYDLDNTAGTFDRAKTFFLGYLGKAWDSGLSLVEKGTGYVSDRTKSLIDKSLPGYTGKVDANAKKDIGVFLEGGLTPVNKDGKFQGGEQVILFSTLRAETLDNPIEITMSCNAEDTKKKANVSATTIYPKEKFTVEISEKEGIDCIFDNLEAGRHKVIMNADFNFETMAYVKIYFIDKMLLRSYRRDNIDPFAKNEITDGKPAPIFTNGPLGVDFRWNTDIPVSLDRSLAQQKYTMGIDIKNRWNGKIMKVKKIVVMLPKGIEVLNVQGTTAEKIACAQLHESTAETQGTIEDESCDDELLTLYKITPQAKIQDSYRAYLTVDPSQYDLVLGTRALEPKWFGAVITYEYKLQQAREITVLPVSETGTTASGTTSSTTTTTSLSFTAINVDESSITDTKAKITWELNKEADISIQYGENMQSQQRQIITTPAGRSKKGDYTLTELKPDTSYSFIIIASNTIVPELGSDETTQSKLRIFKTKQISS